MNNKQRRVLLFSCIAKNISLKSIEEFLNDYSRFRIKEENWLKKLSSDISVLYKKLADDARSNVFLSKNEYCERLAFHYYAVGSCYHENFSKEQFALESVETCLEKCLEIINEIPVKQISTKAKKLKHDAKNSLIEVQKIFETKEANLIKCEADRSQFIKMCIYYGDFEEFKTNTLQECDDNLWQKIANIQLIWIINQLEEIIAVPNSSNVFIIAKYSELIAKAYKLTENFKVAQRYDKTAEILNEKCVTSPDEDPKTVHKHKIDNTIREEIEMFQTNLTNVKSIIVEKFATTLSHFDCIYIQEMYMKFCFEFFMLHVVSFLRETIKSKSYRIYIDLLQFLGQVKSIREIPKCYTSSPYYRLLIEHYSLFDKDEENDFIEKFESECVEHISAFKDFAKKEVNFFEAFVNFFIEFKHTQWIATKLRLHKFSAGTMSFEELLKNVMKCEEIESVEFSALKKAAIELLVEDKELFLTHELRKIANEFLKGVEICLNSIKGRIIIDVIGKNIVFSEIEPKLREKIVENPLVEDLHINGASILHIDANLDNDIWHGKNVFVAVKAIKILGTVMWNVSGKDAVNFSSNAQTENDGHGKQGADGQVGESGGNVLILADSIDFPENFNIISNGGLGGEGQEGGNGKVGLNGLSLTPAQFSDQFPRSSIFNRNHAKCVKNINIDIATVEASFKKDSIIHVPFHYFNHVKTNRGNEIVYSLYNVETVQLFIFYKGSLGQTGETGGEGGLGGEGGYAGDITVKHLTNNDRHFVVINNYNGKEGKKGVGGLYGKHGKNGWDMAYLYYFPNLWMNWPKIYGANMNSKLTLKYTDDKNGIWCPYKRKYASITSARLENVQLNKFDERNSARKQDRQNREKAKRKNAIVIDNASNKYTNRFYSAKEAILQNLQSDLSKVEQRLAQIANDKKKQREKKSTVKRFKRNINYPSSKTYRRKKSDKSLRPKVESRPNQITTTKSSNEVLLYWMRLRNNELVFAEIDKYFTEFGTLKGTYENDSEKRTMLKMSENLLLEKCRSAVLQEIDKQITTKSPKSNVNNELLTKYLYEAEANDKTASHSILGTLDQYFNDHKIDQYEKVEQLLQKCNDDEKIIEGMKASVKKFVFEQSKSSEKSEIIAEYFTEYENFCITRDNSINILYEPLESELRRLNYLNLPCIGNSNEEFRMSAMLKKIQQDEFLEIIHRRFTQELKQDFDWNECLKDQVLLKEHADHIKDKGPKSESYRELLAYIFDLNIRLYGRNELKELCLTGSHNSSATMQFHFYVTANGEFKQLIVCEEYFKLEKERQEKNSIYAKVLSEIELLEQKKDIISYFANGKFVCYDDYLNNDTFYSDYGSNEETHIKKISGTFTDIDEKQKMQCYLEKISSEYIGSSSVIYYIDKRFSNEGRRVSFDELYFLVCCVLNAAVHGDNLGNIFSWIITTCPQTNWLARIILLQLESFLQRSLSDRPEWMEHLLKIDNVDILLSFAMKLDECRLERSVYIECIDTVLRILSCIPTESLNLNEMGLTEWPYALKEKYWEYKLTQILDWSKSDKLPLVAYYILSLENTYGETLMNDFINILEKNKSNLNPDQLCEMASNFYNERGAFTEEEMQNLFNTSIFRRLRFFYSTNKERNFEELVKLIKTNSNTSKRICDRVSSFKTAHNKKSMLEEGDIEKWAKDFKKSAIEFEGDKEKTREYMKQNCRETLDVIDRAIELKRKFKLRDTQKLSVLTFILNDFKTLAQISTGEGKSLIVVTLAIMKALCGERVDVVTSSPVLAKRDADTNGDIYRLFDVHVSHNCIEDIQEKKNMYSSNQVVYGDLSNFQRDYLLDRFYGKNILGSSSYDNVIIDEVDSMLLDKGNNVLYLSHDLPGLDKLESVYVFIWQWINRPTTDIAQILYTFDAEMIKDAVLSNIYTMIKKEDVKCVCSNDGDQSNRLWDYLVKTEILDDKGKLLNNNFDSVKEIVSPSFEKYAEQLLYFLKTCHNAEKYISVPEYLKPFVEQHIDAWIASAKTALFMKDRHDYIVDVDRTGASSDRNPNVIVLDKDTGADHANSQWDKALHQFLQLKHGCRLSTQTLKAVFISNVSFIKLYKNLYGLTGTLGSKRERDLLKEIYTVDFVNIPTAKCKQFVEDQPIVCNSREKWIETILAESLNFTETKKRSVLIICETIDGVEVLSKAFAEKGQKANVNTYTRDYEEFDIVKDDKKLEHGHVIIATNLAGRGTDIKISNLMKKSGGLHVCLTYLPSNIRIEQQAFGRAARCGEKGSGQLIILDPEAYKKQNFKILDLKKQRDSEELHRISEIKAYFESRIVIEENCFQMFQKEYEKLQEDLKRNLVPDELKNIMTQSYLDGWAFWLDKHSKDIDKLANDKKSLDDYLSKLNSKYQEIVCIIPCFMKSLIETLDMISPRTYSISESTKTDLKNCCAWIASPFQILKLAKYFVQRGRHEEAIVIFDHVIKLEPHFCEAAHYYKAHALSRRITRATFTINPSLAGDVKAELCKASAIINKSDEYILRMTSTIQKMKQSNGGILQIEGYEEQQKNLSRINVAFSNSIDDILGHSISPQSFVGLSISEDLSQTIYEDLLDLGILKQFEINHTNLTSRLPKICFEYGIDGKNLHEFLSQFYNFDETELKKKIKDSVTLPSREIFWKQSIELKLFSEETKYVIVSSERLKEVDPSLLKLLSKSKKKLEIQTLERETKQILLYSEQIKQLEDEDLIFIKGDFANIVDTDKYRILKNRRVFKFNKKANLNFDAKTNVNFSHFDSIDYDDFSKHKIGRKVAEEIVNELIISKTLEEKDPNSGIFKLIKHHSEIGKIEISSHPIYENVVKTLLYLQFSYRIAFQEIVDNSDTPNVSLFVKPYNQLIGDLIWENIIKPVSVSSKTRDFEEVLGNSYNRVMKKEHVAKYLTKSKLISKNKCMITLVDHLIEKGWLILFDIKSKLGENLEIYETFSDHYVISNSCIGSLNSNYQDINDTIASLLNNRRTLSEKATQQHLQSTLNRLMSDFDSLDVPEFRLMTLTEIFEKNAFSMAEDLHVFHINGLDEVIQLEEKRWTLKSTLVVLFGMAQIAMGVLIELFSVGLMTSVGAVCIKQGISDLMFACGSALSGRFSWKNYKEQKQMNVITSVCMAAIGGLFAKGVKMSEFGRKLIKSGLMLNGVEGTKSAGMTLINYLGIASVVQVKINIWKEVGKRIISKGVEGVAFGMTNVLVDKFVDNIFDTLCKGILSSIISTIGTSVEGHKFKGTLKKAYEKYGEKTTLEIIENILKGFHKTSENNLINKITTISKTIVNSITEGIKEASKEVGKAEEKVKIPTQVIRENVKWVNRASHLIKIINVINGFLDNVNRELSEGMTKYDSKQNLQDCNSSEGDDYDTFEMKIVEQIKSELSDHVGKIITKHIIKPIINDQATRLVSYVDIQIKDGYEKYKESNYFGKCAELKRKYEEDLRQNQKQDRSVLNSIQEKYQMDMLILLANTKSPKLAAAIVKENIPMNLLCVEACTKVMPSLLGLSGINIQVMGDNGVSQTFSSGNGGPTVSLQLVDNHFKLVGDTNDPAGDGNNNCLFDALQRALPDLNMTPAVFRQNVADCFEGEMRDEIKMGYHKFSMSLGLFGGDRKETKKIPSNELFQMIQNGTVLFSQSSVGIKMRDEMSKSELADLIITNGWEGEISAVEVGIGKDKRLVVLDHRRTLAAGIAGASGNHNNVIVAVYDYDDEFSSENDPEKTSKSKQYEEKKAGSAVKTRMRRGSLTGSEGFGFKSSQMRIRINEGIELNTYKSLKTMKFVMGGKKRGVPDGNTSSTNQSKNSS